MCMHNMKFVGVYHIDPATVWLSNFIKKICSSIGIRTWDLLVAAFQRDHLRHRSD